MNENREAALKLYEVGMTQFLERIRLRDNVLLFYVAAAGAVIGFALNREAPSPEFLIVVPYLAGACGMIMAYQTIFVDALVRYFHDELESRCGDVLPFELSGAFKTRGMLAVRLRVIGNSSTLVLPVLFTTAYSAHWALESADGGLHRIVAWLFSTAFGLLGPGAFFYHDLCHISSVSARNRAHRRSRDGKDVDQLED